MIYGSEQPGSKTILIYGNCQIPFIALLLSSIDDLNDAYRFVCVSNHGAPGEDVPLPDPEHLATAILHLEQFDQREVETIREHTRDHLPPTCPIITYPPIYMACFWPSWCVDPRNKPEPPLYPWGRYPSGDSVVVKVAKLGLTGDAAWNAYLELSHQTLPDMANRLEWDTERMVRTDLFTHVRISDYVLANYSRRHMFWTQGHLDIAAMAELARRIFHLIQPIIGGSIERAEAGFQRIIDSLPGMGEIQLPIHPAVASALKLDFYDEAMTFRWFSQNWTFREYVMRYIAYDTDW